jgi:CDP-glucose 4,6-dehydratase
VAKFCKAWGNGLKWVDKSDGGPHEAAFLKLDNSKIKDTFGWKPRWHIDECIAKIVEWTRIYLNNKENIPEEMNKEIADFFGGIR